MLNSISVLHYMFDFELYFKKPDIFFRVQHWTNVLFVSTLEVQSERRLSTGAELAGTQNKR